MIKLIIGAKGSGKTKALVEATNTTIDNSNGSVVFIAKGKKLIHEIKYQARMIDTEEYNITTYNSLYGLIAGVISSNYDAKDIFVDSALKIIENNVAAFAELLPLIEKLAEAHGVNIVLTSSITKEELPAGLEKYL